MKHALLVLFLLAAPAWAGGVKFPDPPLPVTPPPPPAPTTPVTLNKGQIYVVSSDSPFLLVGSRDGLVKVCALKLPVTIYGEFVDPMPGDDNGRSYTTGAAYVVKPTATGEVELIASTDLTGNALTRRIIQANVAPLPPPVPPIPVPPPQPVDPLLAILQAAYNLDIDVDKAVSIADVARVYKMAAIGVQGKGFTTLAGVTKWINDAFNIKAAAIPNVLAAIGACLNKVLPVPADTPLDQATRDLLTKQFNRIAAALEGIK